MKDGGNLKMKLTLSQKRTLFSICVNCSQPTTIGSVFCLKHKQEMRVRSAENRKKFKVEGRCTRCGVQLHPEVDNGRIECDACNHRKRN